MSTLLRRRWKNTHATSKMYRFSALLCMKSNNVCVSEEETKPAERATATERCQCNLSIVSCLLSCSKLLSVSIDQRKNLLALTFDSSIDHFLLYTVKGKYSDSTQGSGRVSCNQADDLQRPFSIWLHDTVWILRLRVWMLYLPLISLWDHKYCYSFRDSDELNLLFHGGGRSVLCFVGAVKL